MVYVVFGVGNPGPEYADTRHNLGFRVVDRLARDAWRPLGRLRGLPAEGIGIRVDGAPVLLVKPLTWVNRCGPVLRHILDLEEIPPGRALVVVDDIHLPLGGIRLRPGGSDGGHNGLRSVQQCLGSEAFPRLRIGIGPARPPLERFVLEPFPEAERPVVAAAVERAARAVATWVRLGTERAMAEVNRRDLDPPADRA